MWVFLLLERLCISHFMKAGAGPGQLGRTVAFLSVCAYNSFLVLLTAANQKEPMNLHFKVKEEPKDDEALGTTLPRPSYVFTPESDVPAPGIAEDALKAQEGKANVLRRDMSVKAASELLMKLSGG